jgi:radical SAM protein with 4Fe4S-binding SPASM domain
MKMLKEFFRISLPERPAQPKPGIYHFRREAGGKVTRFHLRVEEDGSGVLLANASIAARLSPTGVMIAKQRLEGIAYPVIAKSIKDNFYGATESQIESDVRRITKIIGSMSNLEDNYPVFNLDDPETAPPRSLIAPFHAQMTVTAPDKMNPLLEKLWEGGILHVTFQADLKSSGDDAVRNVERAEDLGMISGVRAFAGWFLQSELFRRLAVAGVDFITMPAVSINQEKQDALFGEGYHAALVQCLQECKQWEVTPVLEIPIFRENLNDLEVMLNEFSAKGVKNVFYYSVAGDTQGRQDGGGRRLTGTEIIQAASLVEQISQRSDVRYVWLPAVHSTGDLKQVIEVGPRTAGDVSIHVESDGSVYAPRGSFVSSGNLLNESLSQIWSKDTFRRYRERLQSPTHCEICPGLHVCAADCPANPQGWDEQGENR